MSCIAVCHEDAKLIKLLIKIPQMADAALSSLLQVIFQNIVELIRTEVRLHRDICKGLEKLKITVRRIQTILAEAEGRQQSAEVESLIRELREVAYMASDVVDEVKVEAQRRSTRKLRQLRESLSYLNPKYIWYRHALADQISSVEERLDVIVRNNSLGIRAGSASGRERELGQPTTSFRGGKTVYGREVEIRTMVEWLTTEGSSGSDLSVIAIHGMGGIGKTSLAREVYNDERVIRHFDLPMWVHVSSNFDLTRLTNQIMESIDGVTSSLSNLNVLHQRLREKLWGKKFLLVLDDMWNELPEDWDGIRTLLSVGARGSWILVTTRSRLVAKIAGTVEPCDLKRLSNEDCWFVFCQHAFEDDDDIINSQELVEIGHEIAKKCQGSPLAARTLGSRLRFHRDAARWQCVLLDWQSHEGCNEVVQSLIPSYHLLPAHLKACFRYCSIFPKGYMFDRNALILLWMAQGLFPTCSQKRPEDQGNECFDCLVHGSFLQQSAKDPSKFVMHDIFHDMAQKVSQEECCIINHENSMNLPENIRHSSLICNHFDPLSPPSHNFSCSPSSSSSFTALPPCIDLAYRFKKLHSLVLFCISPICTQCVPGKLAGYLKYLRILDLSNTMIQTLEGSIGSFWHLRYLNLSNTNIDTIPDSLNNLHNLQSLLLRNCYRLVKLPLKVKNLTGLRHLDLHLDTSFTDDKENVQQSCQDHSIAMPMDLGTLVKLQTLSRFSVSNNRDFGGIGDLKDLDELHGDLHITNLQNIYSIEEAKSANMTSKIFIERLKLQWNEDQPSPDINTEPDDVCNGLKPNANLKVLRIEGYRGIILPYWIEGSYLTSLTRLAISSCRSCKWLPCLGKLQLLKYLQIEGMDNIESIDCEFCGNGGIIGFPSLKVLEFQNMPNWKGWTGNHRCRIPALRRLVIKDCPKVSLLTHNLPSLNSLEMDSCPGLLCLDGLPSLHDLEVKASGEWILSQWPFSASLVSLTLESLPTKKGLHLEHYKVLRHLEITNCINLESLRDNCFPAKLTHLAIRVCPMLRTLPRGFDKLIHLVEMEIVDCGKMTLLPEDLGLLHSLELLKISGCPRLQRLPTNGLPRSVQVFSISYCPLLTPRCHPDHGADWPKLRQVPLLCLDGQHVHVTEQHFPKSKQLEFPGKSSKS